MTADERIALIRRKIERAKTHFDNLEAVKNRFIQSEPYTIGSEPDPKPGHEGLHRFFPTTLDEIDPDIALTAGDIIHNLRSALDHLACQLVEVAGNSVSEQTMFPISKRDSINEPSFRGQVQGMRQSAQDLIRSAEPYKGGQGHFLWVLHKLDIADKHKTLLTTFVRLGDVIIPSRGHGFNFAIPLFAAPNYGESLEVGKPFFACHPEEYENMQIAFEIAISEPNVIEPKPIMWATKFLIDKVDSLILDFKNELS
jgi:hypothetical protein